MPLSHLTSSPSLTQPISNLDKRHPQAGSSELSPRASPLPTSAATQHELYEHEGVPDEAVHDDKVDDEEPRPQLQPFFTLVEDESTQTTVHPSVTYVFADDEHDPVTEAAIRIQKKRSQQKPRGSQQQVPGVEIEASERKKSAQVRPAESIERCILVTLGPDGRSIQSAQSLTSDWHVDDAELTPAPTLDNDGTIGGVGISPGTMNSRIRRVSATVVDRLNIDEERERLRAQQEDGALMLRLHGRGPPTEIGDEEALKLGLDGLRDEYMERLEELRKVISTGEDGDFAMAATLRGAGQQDEAG